MFFPRVSLTMAQYWLKYFSITIQTWLTNTPPKNPVIAHSFVYGCTIAQFCLNHQQSLKISWQILNYGLILFAENLYTILTTKPHVPMWLHAEVTALLFRDSLGIMIFCMTDIHVSLESSELFGIMWTLVRILMLTVVIHDSSWYFFFNVKSMNCHVILITCKNQWWNQVCWLQLFPSMYIYGDVDTTIIP